MWNMSLELNTSLELTVLSSLFAGVWESFERRLRLKGVSGTFTSREDILLFLPSGFLTDVKEEVAWLEHLGSFGATCVDDRRRFADCARDFTGRCM